MRKEALQIMKLFKTCHPFLIGSVWRGTNRKGSDIDIALYHDTPTEIVSLLKTNNLKIAKTEWTDVTKHGKTESSFHIHTETPTKQKIEIVVRCAEEAGKKRKCEVFGDELKGLSIRELETLLKENPQQKFVPG
jgi:predicted nucleotidyltransferase